jgi:hypothetical protein
MANVGLSSETALQLLNNPTNKCRISLHLPSVVPVGTQHLNHSGQDRPKKIRYYRYLKNFVKRAVNTNNRHDNCL